MGVIVNAVESTRKLQTIRGGLENRFKNHKRVQMIDTTNRLAGSNMGEGWRICPILSACPDIG